MLLLFRQHKGHSAESSSSEEETDAEMEEEEEEEEGSVPDDVLIKKTDPKDWVLLIEGDRNRRP